MSTEIAAKKPVYKKWWFWVVLVVVLAALGKGGGGGGTTSAGTSSAPPVPLPQAEAQLIQIVSAAQAESRKAENDMQRGGVKAKRDRALCEAVTSLAVSGWIGTVEKIDSNSDGKGVLEIAIADDILVKTWNNAMSDIGSKTLIEPGSPVFQAASAMKRGQRVAFSGTFLKGSEGDCLAEGSLSLRGKIEDPEFIFRFSAISTNLPSQPPVAQQNAAPATTTAPAVPAIQQTAPTTPVDEKQAATRYGQLSIVGEMNDMSITFGGRTLRKGDGLSLSFLERRAVGTNDVILVMNNSGGTACPAQYFFVTVKSATDVQLSPEFGTCSDLIDVSQNGDQINVSMPEASGKRIQYAYAAGAVTENGKPVH